MTGLSATIRIDSSLTKFPLALQEVKEYNASFTFKDVDWPGDYGVEPGNLKEVLLDITKEKNIDLDAFKSGVIHSFLLDNEDPTSILGEKKSLLACLLACLLHNFNGEQLE